MVSYEVWVVSYTFITQTPFVSNLNLKFVVYGPFLPQEVIKIADNDLGFSKSLCSSVP